MLGLFRIVIGLLFAVHGTTKLFGGPPPRAAGRPSVGQWPYWWAGVIELAVGVLVLLGLFTRIAALIGSGAMAFAYFTEHQPKALWPIENGGELAVLYLLLAVPHRLRGPGAFAIGGRARR